MRSQKPNLSDCGRNTPPASERPRRRLDQDGPRDRAASTAAGKPGKTTIQKLPVAGAQNATRKELTNQVDYG